MNADQASTEFEHLLKRVHPSAILQFLQLAEERIKDAYADIQDNHTNNDAILENIRDDIRQTLPVSALSDTEKIQHPTNGIMQPETTIHVDAFLYDDDYFDSLCEEGKLSRNYCAKCGSHDTRPLTVITHSSSVPQLKFIFQHVLPSLHNKTLLDVGSRTGAVLYGAYLFSDCRRIIGVEMDPSFCELQRQIVSRYCFEDRVQIIQDDILNQLEGVRNCDVIILNNVFEYFLSKEDQQRTWKQLYLALKGKSGTVLVTVPSVEESIESLETGIDVGTWLEPVDLTAKRNEAKLHVFGCGDCDSDELDKIFLYKII
ncbi:hypothetical protein BaRGS_00003981 [Batillaria attramentaria]|uniref:Methyltransferase type 12 domain-containing protein n=1 Tax=Batillaria attramentaria TaxID=370345 RepID=A0ABD0LZR9_9CAEN